MKVRAFNSQAFLEFLCYSVFAGLMLYLVKSGKYLTYVTPRMKPYLYFSAVIMGLWALLGLGRLFRLQYRIRSAHCYVLAVPILLLLLPHDPLNISDLSRYYTGVNTVIDQAGQGLYGTVKSPKQSPEDNSGISTLTGIPADTPEEAVTGIPAGVPEDAYTTILPGLNLSDRKITVSNDDFSLWLTELYTNMGNYKGYTIIMTGFVFKDSDTLKEDEFITARLMMSCCAADLIPYGLICKYDKVSDLKSEAWVTVEGTLIIEQFEYDGKFYDDPQISVTKISPAEKVEDYVYPFY